MFQTLAEFYLKHFPHRLTLTRTRIEFDHHSFLSPLKLRAALEKAATYDPAIAPLFFAQFGAHMAVMSQGTFAEDLERCLISLLKKPAHKAADPNDLKWSKENPAALSDLVYCRDVSDPESSVMWDTKRDAPLPDCREAIESNLKFLFGEDDESRCSWLAKNAKNIVRIYMPGGERFITNEMDHVCLNTYETPEYLRGWSPPTSKTHPPEELMSLLKIIYRESSFEDVLKWERDAIFDRAHSILVLAGSPEIGKNLRVEHFLKALVGSSNFHKSTMSFKKEMFNGVWPNKRIGFLDELKLDEEVRDILKNWHNPTATFNRKHVETDLPEKVHTSFVVANNYERKIKLEYNDRKFFVPDLNRRPLKEYWDDNKIDHFNFELCQNVGFLRACAAFYSSNFKKDSSRRFFKNTEAFNNACYYGQSDWFRRLITACESSEVVKSNHFKGISSTTVKDEIDHYEAVTGRKIGIVEVPKDGSAKWSVQSLVFKK